MRSATLVIAHGFVLVSVSLTLAALCACGATSGGSPASCSADQECAHDAFCEATVCVDRLGPDAACQRASQCQDGLACNQGVCVGVGVVGDACTARQQCSAPLACVEAACAVGANPGEACAARDTCAQPYDCVNDVCGERDYDGDGFQDPSSGGEDCDDNDPGVNPGAVDVCGDGVDQNCDGVDNPCPPPGACQYIPDTDVFEPFVEWGFSGASMARDEPDYVHACTTPVVVPLSDDNHNGVVDDNDIPSVVVTTYMGTTYTRDGVIRAFRGDTGEELWNTKPHTDRRTDATSNLAAGDLDGDGWPEIVAQHEDKHLMAFDTNGTPMWQALGAIAPTSASPAIADLDHDGHPEVVFGNHVVSYAGVVLATGTQAATGSNGAFSIPCVADLDETGNMEMITGNVAYRFAGTSLTPFWPADPARDALGDGYCAVADVDMDGKADVVHVRSAVVTIIDGPSGVIKGSVDVAAATTSDDTQGDQGRCGAPTIDDFDSDGLPEIGMACKWGYAVFDVASQGAQIALPLLWEQTTEDNSSHATGSSVFDFQADGQAEVVYNDEEYLRVYDGKTGAVVFEVPNSTRTRSENPVIVDVDNDGNAEIVVVSSNDTAFPHDESIALRHGIAVYGDLGDNWVPTRRIWNQHTYHVTNVNDDGTIPTHEAHSWAGFNNYRANSQGDGVFHAPDLVAQIVSATCTAGVVTVTVAVFNQGTLKVGPNVPVHLVIKDSDGNVIMDEFAVTTQTLDPGSSQQVEVEVAAATGAGTYVLTATADEYPGGVDTQNECDETNNSAERDLTCSID